MRRTRRVLSRVAAASVVSTVACGGFGVSPAGSRRVRILDFVAASRLPSMFRSSRDSVDGGLLFYSEDVLDQIRRATPYVDRDPQGR